MSLRVPRGQARAGLDHRGELVDDQISSGAQGASIHYPRNSLVSVMVLALILRETGRFVSERLAITTQHKRAAALSAVPMHQRIDFNVETGPSHCARTDGGVEEKSSATRRGQGACGSDDRSFER